MKKHLLVLIALSYVPLFCMKKSMPHLSLTIPFVYSENQKNYWQKTLQYYFSSKTKKATGLALAYLREDLTRLDKEIYYKEGHDGTFTPLCLAILEGNKPFIKWISKKTSQNLFSPRFLQYLVKKVDDEKMNALIIRYFEKYKQLINEKMYSLNETDNLFTPLQLALIHDNMIVCDKLESLGADGLILFCTDFLQYLIKNKSFNMITVSYFTKNKQLLNKRIYEKESDQKSPFKIFYTPLRLALLFKNAALAYQLFKMGATLTNVYDQQMFLKLMIKAQATFATEPLNRLLNNKNLITQTMNFNETGDTPLEYALFRENFKAHLNILIKVIQFNLIDQWMTDSKLM